MEPELWERVKPLLAAALQRDAGSRAAFAAEACGADTELKQHLLLLLDSQAEETVAPDKPPSGSGGLAAASAHRFQPGEIVLGRFHIVRLLGHGGMGEVFEADDLQLGRIALKTIRPAIAASPHSFDRFRREVQLARKVSGPQVCRIHELFLLPASGSRGATAFLTMEYLDGMTLAAKLQKSGPLPPSEALALALDICEGLRLIHDQGIVHRDLKSANIMLCRRGDRERAVLMDFGLAFEGSADSGSGIEATSTSVSSGQDSGVMAGTPAYMAPEQFEGAAVSPATDIYALGLVLYELLTGIRPYAADTPMGAAIRRARRPEPVSSLLRKVPRRWDRVIERCLEYEPRRRFQSAAEVAAALQAGPVDLRHLRRDHPLLLWPAAALLLAAALWGGWSWWQSHQYYQPQPEAERWYQAGVSALRDASDLKAARALQSAVAADPHFAMAHARLAEAWSNLGFDGAAQREMLIAGAGENHVDPLDRLYLDAIRATLTRDYPGALSLYRTILDRLPNSDKYAGYVELGMAQERAGDPKDALASYGQAARLNPDSPAPWLREGMLESRMNYVAQANAAFGKAAAIYTAEMNPEGQAEMDYQRGYLLSLSGRPGAKVFLDRSLEEARKLPSIPLQIQDLTQLSSLECATGDTSDAVSDATAAIQLARDNQLDAWAAMGLARLGNARLNEGSAHYAEAEQAVTEARDLAMDTQQFRAEALANIVLASLRDSEGRPDEVIAPATAALNYYRTHGYAGPAAAATLLLLRASESRGDVQHALATATQFASLAKASGNSYLVYEAEVELGYAYAALEQYPEALLHDQNAMKLAGSDTMRGYAAAAGAMALIRLNRMREAEATLRPLAGNPALSTAVAEAQMADLLASAEYARALTFATDTLHDHPDLPADDKAELPRERALAEAWLHRGKQALDEFSTSSPSAAALNPLLGAKIGLERAEIELLAGDAQAAANDAAQAQSWFAAQGLEDSSLRASLIAALAANELHRSDDAAKWMAKAVDTADTLHHNWGDTAAQLYLARPDLRGLIRELPPSQRAALMKE